MLAVQSHGLELGHQRYPSPQWVVDVGMRRLGFRAGRIGRQEVVQDRDALVVAAVLQQDDPQVVTVGVCAALLLICCEAVQSPSDSKKASNDGLISW